MAACSRPKEYRKIPIISPGLIFVQKAFLLGLFLGELIFGGAYYWREFCVSNGLDLTINTASTNSPWAYSIYGRAYCRKDICV